jgi:hypothetical protein
MARAATAAKHANSRFRLRRVTRFTGSLYKPHTIGPMVARQRYASLRLRMRITSTSPPAYP